VRRALLGIVIGLAAVLLSAAPAAADPARPTNVGSHVSAVTPPTAAVTVDLLGADGFLRLRVDPGTAVTVMGYEGEPYLRIGTDGAVEENRNSKATHLNRTLTGQVEIPPTASPTAAPDWRRIGSGGEYAWHDHRVHWMGAGVPPERQDWQVPLLVDGVPATVVGWYAAEPAPSALPWWVAAVAVALGAGIAGWYGRRRAVAVAVALLAVAIVAAVTDHGAWLAGAGLALLLWAGRRLSVLDHAVLVTSLPAWLDRLAVAAGCGAGVAAVAVGVRAVLRPVSPSAVPRPG
jgi:hypothetical protein